MNYRSIQDWAEAKVKSQTDSIGFSNWTVDFLAKHFNQVVFYEVAGLSKFLLSSHINISIWSQKDEAIRNVGGNGHTTNINFKDCVEEYDADVVHHILEELDRVSAYANSMRNKILELTELQNLPSND